MIAGLAMAAACGLAPSAGPEPSSSAEPMATFPDGHAVRLEIARTPEEHARGYMFRQTVGRREGMLFLFDREDFHSFWMKNCLVSLDLIWLSGDLQVVYFESDVPPCRHDPCPGYTPMRKARYVLEVRGGTSEKAGLRVGDFIQVKGVDLGTLVPSAGPASVQNPNRLRRWLKES
jgi:uncharacterized membrane protein (UPF0127 family)